MKIRDEISIRCDIYGGGPLRKSLEEEIVGKDLGSLVLFKGYTENLRNFLPGYDVFVLPSEVEGMSNALLEAMAAGLPCVVSDIPPNRELVDPDHKCEDPEPGGYAVGEYGIFFRSGDSAGLAEAFRFLYENEEICEKIGKSARARVIRDFSMEEISERYLKLYQDLYGKERKKFKGEVGRETWYDW